jgi:hypothetical protein
MAQLETDRRRRRAGGRAGFRVLTYAAALIVEEKE